MATLPDNIPSEAEVDARLARDRNDITAYIAKADNRLRAGDRRAASAYYNASLQLANQTQPLAAPLIEELRRAHDNVLWLTQQFEQHQADALVAAGYPPGKQHPRFRQALAMLKGEQQRAPEPHRYPQIPQSFYYPGMRHVEYCDPAEFDWVARLEGEFPALREEALKLMEDHSGFAAYMRADHRRPQTDHHGLLENTDWSTLHLWEDGAAIEENIAHCPQIYAAVRNTVPLCHIGPRAPSVMLSLLKAGARIPPHTGMINTRFICHLPLVVPPGCAFRVGGTTREWEEGKTMIFDDTVEHEAWNESEYDRLVLIFDVWRPEITDEEREQIVAMFAAIDNYK